MPWNLTRARLVDAAIRDGILPARFFAPPPPPPPPKIVQVVPAPPGTRVRICYEELEEDEDPDDEELLLERWVRKDPVVLDAICLVHYDIPKRIPTPADAEDDWSWPDAPSRLDAYVQNPRDNCTALASEVFNDPARKVRRTVWYELVAAADEKVINSGGDAGSAPQTMWTTIGGSLLSVRHPRGAPEYGARHATLNSTELAGTTPVTCAGCPLARVPRDRDRPRRYHHEDQGRHRALRSRAPRPRPPAAPLTAASAGGIAARPLPAALRACPRVRVRPAAPGLDGRARMTVAWRSFSPRVRDLQDPTGGASPTNPVEARRRPPAARQDSALARRQPAIVGHHGWPPPRWCRLASLRWFAAPPTRSRCPGPSPTDGRRVPARTAASLAPRPRLPPSIQPAASLARGSAAPAPYPQLFFAAPRAAASPQMVVRDARRVQRDGV